MHKIFFILFLSVVFFFPQSEVLGACSFCPQGREVGNQCSIVAGRAGAMVNKTPGCPAGQQASIPDLNADSCQCVAQGTSGATGPAGTIGIVPGRGGTPIEEPCKVDSNGKSNCSSAKAIPCPDGLPGVMTAIGCVPTEPKALVEGILKFGTLAAGGIAFLLMILGALQMITAEGNPESIKQGQERFYSAIIGLLLIVFSVLLMQVIGVDILNLPNFNR